MTKRRMTRPKQNNMNRSYKHLFVSLDTLDALIDINFKINNLNRTDFKSFVACLIAVYCKNHNYNPFSVIDEIRSALSDK